MRFFVLPNRVIPRGQKITVKDAHIEVHDPEATLVIDGELDASSEDSTTHIYVKNIVVTPRGKLSINNGQIVATDNFINYGGLNLSNSAVIGTSFSTTDKQRIISWQLLRGQIIWARANDSDCKNIPNVQNAVAHAEEQKEIVLRGIRNN